MGKKVNKREFARIAGTSRQTVYNWMRRRVINCTDGLIDVEVSMTAVKRMREGREPKNISEVLRGLDLKSLLKEWEGKRTARRKKK